MGKNSKSPFGRRPVLKAALIVFLIITATFLLYFPSYSRYRELKIEADQLNAQLQDLQAQVTALQHEKQLLRNDKNYMETVIRKELGLVGPGEVVYEFEKRPVLKQTTDQRPPTKDEKSKTTNSTQLPAKG